MKSELVRTSDPAPPSSFPRLVKSVENGFVVLFTSLNVGTVVYACSRKPYYSLGLHSGDWTDCTDSKVWQALDCGEKVVLS